MAIKVLSKLAENIEVVEEEYRIFKDLSRHDTFPEFYGAFLNKHDKSDKDEVWLVLEVWHKLNSEITSITFYSSTIITISKLILVDTNLELIN